VRICADYETGLQRRGALTVWLSDAALEAWRDPATGRRPAVSADTGEVLASGLTSRRTADCARVPELLDQIDDRVATFMADGAYDAGAVYEAAQEKGGGRRVTVLIPPGRGAQPSSSRSPGQRERSRSLVGQRIEVVLACKILGHDDRSGDAR
jgi:hypothetical protein